jgi:hypothetical protein
VSGTGGSTTSIDHRFRPGSIATHYAVYAPHGAAVLVRVPVWARLEPPRRPAVATRSGHAAVRVEQSAGGYRAEVDAGAAAGPVRAIWRTIGSPARSTPGTAGVMFVRVPLHGGHANVVVTLRPFATP